MTTYMFDGEVAKTCGVNAAVLFQNISWWVAKNAANSHNIKDGKAWTFNSTKALADLFDWMTEKQVRSALAKLEELDLIETGCFNKLSYDRTKWYTVGKAGARYVGSICPKGQIETPKKANRNALQGKPIPVSNPVINTDLIEGEAKASKPTRHKHGEYGNVLLTDEELSKLQAEYPDWQQRIERLSEYIASSGKRYKSHYATIRAWARKDGKSSKAKPEEKRININDYMNPPMSACQPWEIAPEGTQMEEAVDKGFRYLQDGTRVPRPLEWAMSKEGR